MRIRVPLLSGFHLTGRFLLVFNRFVVLLYCFRFVGIDYYWSVYCQIILVIVGLYHYCRGIVVFC